MRYLDYVFAWAILLTAVSFMLAIEILHLPNAILDIPFLWLLVAMLNFLRLRNGYARVPGLMVTCVGANVVALTLEIVRWRLFGSGILKAWGLYTFVAAVAFLGETILSVVRKNDPGSAARL
jgi:hypothetical protein